MHYFLDDKSNAYHGRKVIVVERRANNVVIVKVAGTDVRLVTTLWHLAAGKESVAQ